MPEWLKEKSNIIIAITLGLLSFGLYVKTLAPTVLMGDGGEFQFVPYLAGIAHPTGYPLYTMLGWLWSHALPLGEVAYRMNLFSALWAAITVTLLYLTVERAVRLAASGAPRSLSFAAAALGSLVFAFSETFWSQALIAEVYSLNSAFVALMLYLLLQFGAQLQPNEKGSKQGAASDTSLSATYLLLAAFAYGLSLTHHRTMILLAPAILVFVWLIERRVFRYVKAIKLAVFFFLPLLLYLYIPWRAPHTPYLRLPLSAEKGLILYHNTLSGFLDHVLGWVFSSQLGYRVQIWTRLAMAADLLGRQFGWLGIALGLLGLLRALFSRKWPFLAFTVLAYLAGTAFNLIYFIGDIHVLFIPSYLIFTLWLALGAETLAEGAGVGIVRIWERGYHGVVTGIRDRVSVVAIVPFFLLPAFLLVHNYPRLDQSRNYEARDFWQGILAAPLPRRAILVSNDRDEIMPLWYYQYIDGKRPDWMGVFPLIVPQPGYENVGRTIDSLLEAGRPIYLIKEMPGLEVKYRLEPVSSLVQVVSPAVDKAPDHPRELLMAETIRLIGYDQEPYSPGPGESLCITLYWQGVVVEMEEVYSSFVHLVDVSSRFLAGSDHQPGGDFYPTDLWRPGEILRDEHLIEIPADAPPGSYGLLVGMYRYPSLEPLGRNALVGRVEIK